MFQLPLKLPPRQLLGRADFYISDCNLEVVEWIDSYPDWNGIDALLITGEAKSGKTHALYLAAEKTGAQVISAAELACFFFGDMLDSCGVLAIDDIDGIAGDNAAEEALFHIINYARSVHANLFLSSKKPAQDIGFALTDLKTRLASLPIARIYAPDDRFLEALLLKQLYDRGIGANAATISFILKRISRSPDSISDFVTHAYERSRPLTTPLAHEILSETA